MFHPMNSITERARIANEAQIAESKASPITRSGATFRLFSLRQLSFRSMTRPRIVPRATNMSGAPDCGQPTTI